MITATERDELAGAYVLGTLDASDRSIARTLATVDPAFAKLVRRHAARLYPLNELVIAIEPPADLWERITHRRRPPQRTQPAPPLAVDDPPLPEDAAPSHTPDLPPAEAVALPDPPASAPSDYLEVAPPPVDERVLTAEGFLHDMEEVLAPRLPHEARSRIAHEFDNQLVIAAGRVRRSRDGWRVLAVLTSLVALLLTSWVLVRELRPHLIPANLDEAIAGLRKIADPPQNLIPVPQQPVMVGVLMPAQAANPGFVIGLDLVSRSLIINTIPADPPTGQAHELWLVVPSLPGPQSLGVIKSTGVLHPAVLGTLDAKVIARAQFAITLEPSGGSPTGSPTGPVIFGGTLMAP